VYNAFMFGSCSICAAPAEVQSAINRGLAARVKLRILAQESGLSKSAIHRHSQKCIARQTLKTFKAARFNAATGRIFVQWPNDPSAPDHLRGRIFPNYRPITENDVLIVVTYEQAATIGNPIALAPNGWDEKAQKAFQKRVPTQEKKHFIDGEHARALAEHAERKDIPSATDPQALAGLDS
jgi:hypothetical protein